MPILQFVFLEGTLYKQARKAYEDACRIVGIEPNGILYVNRALENQPVISGSYCRLTLSPEYVADEEAWRRMVEEIKEHPDVDPETVELLPDLS